MKIILWVLLFAGVSAAEAVTLTWVVSALHDWFAPIPTMDFGSAFGVAITLSCALSVWKFGEWLLEKVNEL